MKKKILTLLAIAVAATLFAPPASAQWKLVKKFVQPDVEIVDESKAALILRHPDIDALVVMTLKPGEEVAVTLGDGEEGDIYGTMNQKRGGNPYRVWVASEGFWNDPERPKQIWGRFFRTEFLKILRPPSDPDEAAR